MLVEVIKRHKYGGKYREIGEIYDISSKYVNIFVAVKYVVKSEKEKQKVIKIIEIKEDKTESLEETAPKQKRKYCKKK
jgi:hypothetical protein